MTNEIKLIKQLNKNTYLDPKKSTINPPDNAPNGITP
jgi:hypothetical protein